ncbi:MAG TPA: twin transmembrane helix small protein [Caulobacteraceae bacterium]
MDIFDILILVALLAVVITLGLGFYSLHRGGEFSRSYSNKLMRLRVVLQFVAILLILAGFYVHHH